MSLYDAIKDAAKIAHKAGNIEIYQKVLDLQAQALSEQETQSRLRLRVTELEAEVAALKAEIEFAGSLQYDPQIQAYVLKEGSDPPALICSRCWDRTKKAMRLHDYRNGWWGCPDCKTTVEHSR